MTAINEQNRRKAQAAQDRTKNRVQRIESAKILYALKSRSLAKGEQP